VDQPRRVLVVDDEPVMRELLTLMLEPQGFQVDVAENGEQALRAMEATSFDLVLLDLRMPRMSGWEVIQRLKAQAAPPPVVAMSGMGTEEPPELQAVSRFVYGYLPKPFTPVELVKTCTRALSAAHPRPADTTEYPQRRKEPRRDLVVPATLLSPEGVPAAVGQILSLSASGAQFDLGAPLQVGTELRLDFEIPGGHGPFHVTARIQWRDDCKLGLSFTHVHDEDRRRLSELLGS
jgi:CheY-like chemotaxis protein